MNAPDWDEAVRLAQRVVRGADARGVRFATAESCTGGLVGHLVTEVPGASRVYVGGWVCYEDRRKLEDLGVAAAQIQRHGAVSQPVVETMAQSARKRGDVDFAVATTGIAGPTGGTPDKPLGTLWVAVAGPGRVEAFLHRSTADGRTSRKVDFAATALRRLLAALETAPPQ